MTTYVKTIKTTVRKSNTMSGEMDDVVSSKKELLSRNLGEFYEKGMLIFVEDESQVYKIFQKEVLSLQHD